MKKKRGDSIEGPFVEGLVSRVGKNHTLRDEKEDNLNLGWFPDDHWYYYHRVY